MRFVLAVLLIGIVGCGTSPSPEPPLVETDADRAMREFNNGVSHADLGQSDKAIEEIEERIVELINAHTSTLILLGVVLCWLLTRLVNASHKKTVAAWRQAAEELGINFNTPACAVSFLMEGNVAGYQVKVHTYTQRSGENSQTYTAFRVSFPGSLDLGLKLSGELKFFSGVAKFFGSQDITTGDLSFDETFVIKGLDAEAVNDFLNDDRRQQLAELHQQQKGMGIVVTDTDISVTGRGRVRKVEVITGHVANLTRVAFALSGHLAKELGVDP